MTEIKIEKVSDGIYEIKKGVKPCMKVPVRVYARENLIKKMQQDRTFEQGVNVACLQGIQKYAVIMPDGHQGYGFPIGGVAGISAENGVISPGGVGYDINCLAPGSKVLTEHGYWISAEEMPKKFNLQGVKVYNINEGHNDFSEVAFVAEREVEDNELAVKIVTESGRVIEGSEDHPVLTPKGYVFLGNIQEGDMVFIYPFEGVEFKAMNGILISEEDFREVDEQAIAYLKKRNLLPLRWDDPKLGILARILGFAFGDGHLGEMSGRLTFSLYGTHETLSELKKDLEKLGIRSNLYVRERDYSIETIKGSYTGKSVSAELRISSRAFAHLMKKLEMPLGKKVENPYRVPEWIKEAPLWIKRNFLAGFFASDGSIIEFKGVTPLPINLTQSKIENLENNLKEFMDEIAKLLEEFDVSTTIYRVRSKQGVTYRLALVGEESIRNFLSKINYEYSLEKKAKGLIAYAYLRFKERVKAERMKASETARDVYQRTGSVFKAYEAVKTIVNRRFVERAIYEGYKDARISKDFPTFEEFAKEKGHDGGFVVERIVKVERVKPKYEKFYDIGVYHEAHNFIANGIVVHNCGVRMMRTNLTYKDIKGKLVDLLRMIFTNVPSGVGSKGKIRIGPNSPEMDGVLERGAKWAIEQGYGWEEDAQFIEENGSMKTADPSNVSFKARKRGAPQIGTLGSGNHFLEIQRVAEIYEPETAKVFGITDVDQITVMIHSGSRGLGHQVCSDYLQTMVRAAAKYGVELPDKELAAVPFNSREGQQYFTAMSSAANFAWANRQAMMHWTREAFEKYFRTSAEDLGMHLIYDVAHNIAKVEEHDVNGKRMKLVVHRKGATRAFPKGHPDIPEKYRSVGQPVLIPGTMGTSSYLLVGDPRSMDISFGSTAHGAGRMLSRAAAKRRYYGKDVQRDLKHQGIIVMSASSVVIAEEAPGAYKNVDDVVRVSHDVGIARLVAKLVPLGVVKG